MLIYVTFYIYFQLSPSLFRLCCFVTSNQYWGKIDIIIAYYQCFSSAADFGFFDQSVFQGLITALPNWNTALKSIWAQLCLRFNHLKTLSPPLWWVSSPKASCQGQATSPQGRKIWSRASTLSPQWTPIFLQASDSQSLYQASMANVVHVFMGTLTKTKKELWFYSLTSQKVL